MRGPLEEAEFGDFPPLGEFFGNFDSLLFPPLSFFCKLYVNQDSNCSTSLSAHQLLVLTSLQLTPYLTVTH